MARRSTPKPVTIPKGWTEHHGGGMPVPERSCPAVLFRIGTRIAMGTTEAREWRDRASDSWTWDKPSSMDIIAFQPEPDEWVVVPRYPDSVRV